MNVKAALRKIVPAAVYRPVRIWWHRWQPTRNPGRRQLTPTSRNFGFDRGQCIDRYYIESFLERHRTDIKGHVLEVLDNRYTRQFGGSSVTHSDVLQIEPANRDATIIGDLGTGENIPPETFDCMIVTQTLHLVYEVQSAIAHCYAALKPGGAAVSQRSNR